MNQWLRDALTHCFDRDGFEPTYDDLAAALNQARIGASYDKSTVQKMTTMRAIKLSEAAVLSKATGYPLPSQARTAETFDQRRSKLTPERQELLARYLESLEELEKLEAAGSSGQVAPKPSPD